MVNEEASIGMSGQSVGDVPNGEPTMSNNEATRQVQELAEMANRNAIGVIPGQINRKQQRQLQRHNGPVAQYNNYQQPPVNHVQRVAPAQMVAQPLPQQPQQPVPPPTQP